CAPNLLHRTVRIQLRSRCRYPDHGGVGRDRRPARSGAGCGHHHAAAWTVARVQGLPLDDQWCDPGADRAVPAQRYLGSATFSIMARARIAQDAGSARWKPVMLTLSGISKNFGGVEVLQDVGFTVEAGQVFGLIGPNGAGKTTV